MKPKGESAYLANWLNTYVCTVTDYLKLVDFLPQEVNPFLFQQIKFRVRSTTLKRLKINSRNFVQILSTIRQCAEDKNLKSSYFYGIMPL